MLKNAEKCYKMVQNAGKRFSTMVGETFWIYIHLGPKCSVKKTTNEGRGGNQTMKTGDKLTYLLTYGGLLRTAPHQK